LLVEPDVDTQAFYRECLGSLVSDIECTDDGRVALAIAIARPPSVVVTDTHVPFIDGHSLCRLLRADPATERIRIVVVTSDPSPGNVERARLAGADTVLVKPCSPEMLTTELRKTAAPPPTALADKRLVRSHVRGTTDTPPSAPPVLTCPRCDGALRYTRSHVGGVSVRHPEQWDYYLCAKCGTYQYRQRTRHLRPVKQGDPV
jgi:CheY-like chemotaxis protein